MISPDTVLGRNVKIFQPDLVNLYSCEIGDGTKVGVFVGHGVMFINDAYPSAVNADGSLQSEADWKALETRIGARASLGSNCTIMGGVTVGQSALVGAGAVVTHDVPDYAIVAGVPARIIGDVRQRRSVP